MRRRPQHISLCRAVFVGVVCLALGTLSTLVIAWGCATTGSEYPLVSLALINSHTDNLNHADVIYTWSRRGASRIVRLLSVRLVEDQGGLAFEAQGGSTAVVRYRIHDFELKESAWEEPAWSDSITRDDRTSYVIEQATGWPALALYSRTESDEIGVFNGKHHQWAIPVAPTGCAIGADPSAWRYRALPLRPIWWGFLINTLFYSAIWFGLCFGIGAMRRTIRRRRCRCPMCAYDLRSDLERGCSECGWNRDGTLTTGHTEDTEE